MESSTLNDVLHHLENVARAHARPCPRLLAVSKQQPAAAVEALARAGQRAFGENYVQEALAKQEALAGAGLALEWHLIGHLQSNKAREAARHFDWVQSVDRAKLVAALARYRPAELGPLNVLVQVNIDDEASKQGCAPQMLAGLVQAIEAEPMLRLRGLMAIPAPLEDMAQRRAAFARMHELFKQYRVGRDDFDTLSMGMSHDYPLAIEEGASMVRVGTALFGRRA